MQYTKGKERLLAVLDELGAMASKKGNTAATELLNETHERLKNETITLVVLGEFKRGKSTFINALLGSKPVTHSHCPSDSHTHRYQIRAGYGGRL